MANTTEEYLNEYMQEFANLANGHPQSFELKKMYNSLADYIIRNASKGFTEFVNKKPETELEFRCLRILTDNGKMRQSTMMRWFKAQKYTKDDVSTALLSLLGKQLIIQDGTFYSVQEEQK